MLTFPVDFPDHIPGCLSALELEGHDLELVGGGGGGGGIGEGYKGVFTSDRKRSTSLWIQQN